MDEIARSNHEHPQDSRLLLLDGLRGLAAIFVMWFHLVGGAGYSWFDAAHGRLAVDFFFLLSGFVVGGAYEQKLLTGLSLGRFMIIRTIRLGPMLWLCVIAQQVLTSVRSVSHGNHIDYLSLTFSTLIAMLALPNLSLDSSHYFEPLAARWSLFFEMAVNMAYATSLNYLNDKIIIIIAITSAILLIFIDPLWGIQGVSFFASTLRTCFSFLLGVLIYRYYISKRLIRLNAPTWLIISVVILVCFFPGHTIFEQYFSAVSTFVLLPFVLIAACRVRLGNYSGKIAYILGEMSYPLYLIHRPLQYALLPITKKFGFSASVSTAIIMVSAAILSLFVARMVDEPIRKWLSKRVRRAKPRNDFMVGPVGPLEIAGKLSPDRDLDRA